MDNDINTLKLTSLTYQSLGTAASSAQSCKGYMQNTLK